jgi:GT2 family glycosyltransferase
MNAAIRVARAEVLVFLDGDCIPHRNFVSAYANTVVPGFAYWGRRVMLGPIISARLNVGRMKLPITLGNLLFSDSRRIEEALPLRVLGTQAKSRAISGCNWGICKLHLLAVNGFDEDYVSACVGEDVDVEERLILSGIKLKSMRNRAIVYHLYHRPNENAESHEANLQLMKEKIHRHGAICRNGLQSLISSL